MPDHCILDFQSQPPQMVCLHCGAREELPLPLPVREAERRGNDWIRQHRRCPRPRQGQEVSCTPLAVAPGQLSILSTDPP